MENPWWLEEYYSATGFQRERSNGMWISQSDKVTRICNESDRTCFWTNDQRESKDWCYAVWINASERNYWCNLQQPPKWSVLGHVDCVGPWQSVGVEVILHRLHPGHPRSSWWYLPIHRRRGSQDLLCIYPVSQKKLWSRTLAITSSNLNRFQKFFHYCKEKEISNKPSVIIPTIP